jgi:hypothetical protein
MSRGSATPTADRDHHQRGEGDENRDDHAEPFRWSSARRVGNTWTRKHGGEDRLVDPGQAYGTRPTARRPSAT